MKDINRRTEPRTVALRLWSGMQPEKCVGSPSPSSSTPKKKNWWSLPLSIRSYKLLGFDTRLFFRSGSNGRKRGLAGTSGSRMDGTAAVSTAAMKSASGPHEKWSGRRHSHNSSIPANMFRTHESSFPRY